jgi:hypothetical protein
LRCHTNKNYRKSIDRPILEHFRHEREYSFCNTALNLLLGGPGAAVYNQIDLETIMDIELRCPWCCSQFSANPDTPAECILDRMFDEGPWYALAEGTTFEEMVQTALSERGKILCPDCQAAVAIRGVSLHRRSRGMVLCG